MALGRDLLEARLDVQLGKDCRHPSRCTRNPDGTVSVRPSGTAAGLALAIEVRYGVDYDTVMELAFDRMNEANCDHL